MICYIEEYYLCRARKTGIVVIDIFFHVCYYVGGCHSPTRRLTRFNSRDRLSIPFLMNSIIAFASQSSHVRLFIKATKSRSISNSDPRYPAGQPQHVLESLLTATNSSSWLLFISSPAATIPSVAGEEVTRA